MFLIYLDSSGRPVHTEPENYVLASVITNERNWQTFDNAIKKIKLNHFPHISDGEVELHAKDMVNHSGIYQNLSWKEIYAVFDDIFDFIEDIQNELCIIAVIIDKPRFYENQDIEEWGHKLLFERLQSFLKRQNEKLLKANMSVPEYGMMITDSEGTVKDQKLRNKLKGMLTHGTDYSKLSYLIEDPLFTDSKWRNLSQIVDCVAYCVRKHYRKNTWSFHNQHWNSYFKKIEGKLDNPFGSYQNFGIKIFPDEEKGEG